MNTIVIDGQKYALLPINECDTVCPPRIVTLSDVKCGLDIYIASPTFKSIEFCTITSAPYPTRRSGFMFIKVYKHWYSKLPYINRISNYKSEHSLSDAGIIPNDYNDYKTFFCEQEARQYAGIC